MADFDPLKSDSAVLARPQKTTPFFLVFLVMAAYSITLECALCLFVFFFIQDGKWIQMRINKSYIDLVVPEKALWILKKYRQIWIFQH